VLALIASQALALTGRFTITINFNGKVSGENLILFLISGYAKTEE
jgi:hypothetical protein